MLTVISDQCPVDVESQGARIAGAAVAAASLLRGFLKHGSCDAYLFVDRNAVHSLDRCEYTWLADDHRARARVVTIPQFAANPPTGPTVFFSPGATLHGLYGLRRALQRDEAPCVGMVHAVHGSHLLPPLLGSLCRRGGGPDALICSSEAGRVAVERQIAHVLRTAAISPSGTLRCPVIPLGVDDEYFEARDRVEARRRCGLRDDEVAIVSIGRFSSRTKGDLRPLLVAASELHRTGRTSVRLLLAGDDAEHETRRLLRLCQFLQLEPVVSIIPRIPHPEKLRLLAAGDVFVALSDHTQETFGLSVVEAMAAGLPVVASDWSGLRETVVHGETGFLVPTFMPRYDEPLEALSATGGTLADALTAQTTIVDVPALVCALQQLVDNAALRRDMGERARCRADRLYHISRIVEAHERLWADLLEERSPRCAHEPPAPAIFSFPCSSIFDHYATAPLSEEALVTLTALGARCLEDAGFAGLNALAGSARMFRASDLLRVLRVARDAGAISPAALSRAGADAAGRLALRAAAARLLKVGALAPAEKR